MADALVAVYGTLRQGFHNNYLLDGAEKVGTTELVSDLGMYTSGFLPFARVSTDGVQHRLILEVYKVNDAKLRCLDMLEGHPNWYRRIMVTTEYGPSWVYTLPHGKDSRPTKLKYVPSGDWSDVANVG